MATRRPLIAGNWKMYKPGPEAVRLASELKSAVAGVQDVDIMVAPAFTALESVAGVLRDSNIQLGGQDLFWEVEGAFTGQISASMLKAAGCTCVIIGHSERRQYFGETDATVNKKVKAALVAGLNPVVCVGESESQRESNQTFTVIQGQLVAGLQGLSADDARPMTIAYEPVWAIGTGKTATTDQAQEVHAFVREQIGKSFGNEVAKGMRILYGGSVKPGNIAELMAMPDIDGALVGGASLNADSFAGIVKF
jgi:triosephosphate isomerase